MQKNSARISRKLFLTIIMSICLLLLGTQRFIHGVTSIPQPNITVTPIDATSDTLTVTFSNAVPAGDIVDVELYDGGNTKVWQKTETNGGTTFSETVSKPSGTYSVSIGLFTANWASNYAWFGNVATLSFPNAVITPTKAPGPTVSVSSAGTDRENINVTFSTPVPQGNIVDIEVYNPTMTKVWQYTTIQGGLVFPATTKQLPSDTYTISVGLFTPNWGNNYAWFGRAGSFTLSANSPIPNVTITPTPTMTPTPTPGVVVNQQGLQAALAAYADWKTQYVKTDGTGTRVVRPENSNDTVSEGIGYGLLLSEMAQDGETFRNLWHYAQKYLDGNGLMNWQIDASGTVIGKNSATDADEDIAYALIRANEKWPGNGYDTSAKTMLQAMLAHEVANTNIVTPGDGWGATSLVNPSYIALGYYPVFASFTGDSRWNAVTAACNTWLTNATANANGLSPDWLNTDLSQSSFPSDQHEHDFWYDSSRVPIRLLQVYKLTQNNTAKAILQKQNTFLSGIGAGKLMSGYTLSGTPLTTYLDTTFQSAYTAVGQIDNQSQFAASTLDSLKTTTPKTYFGTSLRALTLFIIASAPGM